MFSGRPIYRQYIGRYLIFFKYWHWPLHFSVWPMCSGRDFYFDSAENCTWQCLSTQLSQSPSCSLSSLTVLSNADRSLSNNQIELLNKAIQM